MFSRSVTLRASRSERKPPTAASLARSGARERSTSCPISVATIRSQRGRRRRTTGAQPELAHALVGHAQVDRLGLALPGQHRPLVLGRQARHREHSRVGAEHHHAGVQRVTGRPHDGGQPGSGLDRLGDLLERIEEGALGAAILAFLGRGHDPIVRSAAEFGHAARYA